MDGNTVTLADLRTGLNIASETSIEQNEESDDNLHADGTLEQSEVDVDGSLFSDESRVLDNEETEPELPSSTSSDASGIKPPERDLGIGLFPAPKVLSSLSGNARPSSSPRKVSFNTVVENRADVNSEEASTTSEAGEVSLLDFANLEPENAAQADSKMTVKQKLERAQAEAEEVLESSPAKASNKRKLGSAIPVKSSRRRGTLSPEELEDLMGFV